MRTCIVVGTDFTAGADAALICADRRARSGDARLVVVHATPPALWRAGEIEQHVQSARHQIEERMALLTKRTPRDYEVVVEHGLPHLVLARIAALKSALLIVGSKRRRSESHARLRDVGERILRLGYSPLLIAREASACGRILVALDRPIYLSAGDSLPRASEEQRLTGARMVVLHCLNDGFLETLVTDLVNGGAYAHEPLGRCSEVADAYHALDAEVRRYGLKAETRVLQGPPERLIPSVASELGADLIIVGPGRHPATSAALAAVVHDAPCSVLVLDASVPTAGAARVEGSDWHLPAAPGT